MPGRYGPWQRCIGTLVLLWAVALPTSLKAQPQPPASASVTSAAPTAAEVRANTVPLIRPRLRLPDSLHQFTVIAVRPTADDPARFEVEVSFRARTPFGSITEHRAKFRMKRSASRRYWIVTAE